MKINKLILLISSLTFTVPLFSSCSKKPEPEPAPIETPEEYIFNRSFSLLAKGDDGENMYWRWGTCWIISDATPNQTNDYTYWIATNWHVICKINELVSQTINNGIYYGSDTQPLNPGFPITEDFGYYEFNSFVKEEESSFTYDRYDNKLDHSIDFYVAKADFANSSMSESIKNKLNFINNYQSQKKYINKYPQIDDSIIAKIDKLYTAGYPVKSEYYPTWEYHEIPNSLIYYGIIHNYGYDKPGHPVDAEDPDFANVWDVSPNFKLRRPYSSGWMDGGASGSMLITKLNNEWQVIGIYWGTWEELDGFHPSYSIFNSSFQNFIKKYT